MQPSFVRSQSSYPDIHGQPMSPSFVPRQRQSYQDDTRGEPMQLDTLRMAHDDTSTPVQIGAFRIKTQPLKKLTGEERAHLRSTNACFKCRKQGHLARDCPTKTSYPDSKKPGPPVDVDVSAGRRPLEIPPMTIDSITAWCPHDPCYDARYGIDPGKYYLCRQSRWQSCHTPTSWSKSQAWISRNPWYTWRR